VKKHLLFCAQWTLSVALVILVCACGAKTEDPRPKGASNPAVQVKIAPKPPEEEKKGSLFFRDMAHQAGLTFRTKCGTEEKMWIPETMGHGVAIFDFDNDGDLDLYFGNGGQLKGPKDTNEYFNSLWRNDGDWKFTDVTQGSGVECSEWSCGTFAADYDGDGFIDIFLTQFGKNRLFRNLKGSGKFEDVTDSVGLGYKGWSTSAAFFDADNDGDLDLYVCNYVIFNRDAPPHNGKPCEWRKLKVCCGPRGLPRAYDIFYEQRNGKFVDATEKFGFVPTDSKGQKHGAYSLGVVTSDLDRDGDVDVYVAVDSRPNLLYENLGSGKYKEVSQEWQTARNVDGEDQAGMGVAAADLNGDLMPDLFVTNFSHDTNTLYLNAGQKENMYFDDRSSQVGLGGSASFPYLSWGIGIEDFNCDGMLDIYVASGHVYPQAGWAPGLGTSYNQPNQLYIAKNQLQFEDRSPEAGHALSRSQVSRSLACADFDRDGRVDLVVTNNDDYPQILRHECDQVGNWWGFHLRAKNTMNRTAIGASIVFETNQGRKILREINGGGSYQCQGDQSIHLGLPKTESLKSMTCVWPGGKSEQIKVPASSRWYQIIQGSGVAKPE
jgi:hypothetical protein